jgi:hypothetical protein
VRAWHLADITMALRPCVPTLRGEVDIGEGASMSANDPKLTCQIPRKTIKIRHLFAGRVAGIKKYAHEVLLAD